MVFETRPRAGFFTSDRLLLAVSGSSQQPVRCDSNDRYLEGLTFAHF
jgi:hypothetical protein